MRLLRLLTISVALAACARVPPSNGSVRWAASSAMRRVLQEG